MLNEGGGSTHKSSVLWKSLTPLGIHQRDFTRLIKKVFAHKIALVKLAGFYHYLEVQPPLQ